jgi:hypothetical protein
VLGYLASSTLSRSHRLGCEPWWDPLFVLLPFLFPLLPKRLPREVQPALARDSVAQSIRALHLPFLLVVSSLSAKIFYRLLPSLFSAVVSSGLMPFFPTQALSEGPKSRFLGLVYGGPVAPSTHVTNHTGAVYAIAAKHVPRCFRLLPWGFSSSLWPFS